MTGTLQNYARKYQTAIDCLGFTFHVLRGTTTAASVTTSPSDGIYIDGLWLEGASWNAAEACLADAKPGEMYCAMPLIHFLPAPNIERRHQDKDYACPVYKTSVRKGVLSTTGLSTNFVLAVYLPTPHDGPDHWVLNGTAFLLNLDS
jgi:dynein heavy chain